MTIEIEFPVSSNPEEACSFTIWLPTEEASTAEYQQAIAAAEHRMTDMPAPTCDGQTATADTFLGRWL
jgi:hypothetical protein